MNLLSETKLINTDVLALLGYVIVCNNQIHSFQVKEINKFLESTKMLSEADKVMAVLDGKNEALALSDIFELFSKEKLEVKRDIYWLCCVLAQIDGIIDTKEQEILLSIRKLLGPVEYLPELESSAKEYAIKARNEYIKVKDDSDQKPSENIFLKIFRFLHGIRKCFSKTDKNMPRISDKAYFDILNKCGQIAEEDFKFLRPAYEALYNESINVAEKIDNYRNGLNLTGSRYNSETYKIIGEFMDIFRDKVIAQLEQAKEELLKKEHALTDYSIALIGRTKAGKTTLHSILTGEGKEKIGIGMQRTTRYNRIYQWKHLRIIDTPGIGSAEAEGRTDDEIAESAIGEADITCFVIADDSIQQDILDFLDRIAKRNKPVIILLNHKENIRNEVRFKRFIKNPERWLNESDGVSGHINRILRHARDMGYERIISIYPVFLLAKLMSEEDEYSKYKKMLAKASKIDDFFYALRKKVTDAGTISKSQTILDDSLGFFCLWKGQIEKAMATVNNFKIQLEGRHQPAIYKLNRLKDNFCAKTKNFLEHRFDILANQETLKFAESHYTVKRGLEEKWGEYLKYIKFEETIANELKLYSNDFSAGVQEVIEELAEDIKLSVSKMKPEISDLSVISTFSFKNWVGLFGGALGVTGAIFFLASIPVVGWILTGLGIVVSFISGFFKSKEKKRQEAIENIQSQLKNSINKNAPAYISKQLESINENCIDTIDKVDGVFKDLIGGISDIEEIIYTLTGQYDRTIEFLNRVYAWRIINFISKESRYDLQDIIDVKRSYGSNMYIAVIDRGELKTDMLQKFMKENVTVEKVKADFHDKKGLK
ncbi:MAG TPA: 50S ribosome-binding GTPase [Mobilitalea sp.]|nr:50S ribosome-binding GTPase [Mobilitalea sp.]